MAIFLALPIVDIKKKNCLSRWRRFKDGYGHYLCNTVEEGVNSLTVPRGGAALNVLAPPAQTHTQT